MTFKEDPSFCQKMFLGRSGIVFRSRCGFLSENAKKSKNIQQFCALICYNSGEMKRDLLEQKIAEYTAGNTAAFDDLYEMTNRAVYFGILYIVRDKMHAEDLMHETYIRAMQNITSYRSGTNFSAWLMRVGKNLALNFLERQKREMPTDFEEESYRYGTSETELPFIFEAARKILSEEEYEILMLCQVAGYKRREVSAMLSMPIATVTWKNNEALKKLKKYLEKEGGR